MKYFINIFLFLTPFFLFPVVHAVGQDLGRAEDTEYYSNTEIQVVQATNAMPMPPSRTVIPQNPSTHNELQERAGTVSVIPIKVIPGLPDPKSTKIYRVQVGTFSNIDLAWRLHGRLKLIGLNPAFEPHSTMYRVVIPGVRAVNIPEIIQCLEIAGVYEAWIRVEN
jgi:cell division protein FtsN